MKFNSVEGEYGTKFVLEMDFYEANDLLTMILPCAEKGNIERFKEDVRLGDGYVRDDKRRIRKIRWLRNRIQDIFNKYLGEE